MCCCRTPSRSRPRMNGWRLRRRTPSIMRAIRSRWNGSPSLAMLRIRVATRSRASLPTASTIAPHGSRRPSVPDRKAFQYTVLRVVPDVERGERINVGVVVYSPERKFLGARVHVDRERLAAIAPELDLDALERHLGSLVAVADGAAGGGPIAQLPQSERFGALSAPSSTTVQPSEVHTGICEDGSSELEDLFERLVLR